MAMRHSRATVFAGAIGALGVMTALSAALGWAAPALISKTYTHYLAVALFFFFGLRSLYESLLAREGGGMQEELEETESELWQGTGDMDEDTCLGMRGDGGGVGQEGSGKVCADHEAAWVSGENWFGPPSTAVKRTNAERGGWAALQRLDASALCASALVAQDETPCYCGDATDDCFEHPDVIRDLTKYVDEDDDDEDDVEAIAPAPRQAPPAGWGKLLSA